MSNTYQKRPINIQAFQLTRERRTDNSEWPEWLHKAWNKSVSEVGRVFPENYPGSDGTDRLVILTLEGLMTVDFDDYIIQGVRGELYPCKPDIFEETYVRVDDEDQ